MSEEDIDMLGPDGQGAKVDRDRRAPRFSWTPAYETTFFRSLCESVQLGLRENSSFKAEAWERAAQALQDSHGAYPTKNHLINKSDNARKRFRLWRGLREDPEFSYNSKTRTVTATEDAWKAHIDREPLSRALRGRPFDHEDFMETLYPDVIGSGGAPKRIMKPKRKADGQLGDESDMPGTGILNLQTDSSQAEAGSESPVQSQLQQQNVPEGPTVSSAQKPTPTMVSLPKNVPSQPTALTPPDEMGAQGRKRTLLTPTTKPDVPRSESTTPTGLEHQSLGSPEKRVKQTGPDESSSGGSTVSVLNSSVVPIPSTSPPLIVSPPKAHRDANDAKGNPRTARQWQEAAVELFFRDFSNEDADLQITVSQSVLSNEHTAMVFCKMPSKVREHWVRLQRDTGFRRI